MAIVPTTEYLNSGKDSMAYRAPTVAELEEQLLNAKKREHQDELTRLARAKFLAQHKVLVDIKYYTHLLSSPRDCSEAESNIVVEFCRAQLNRLTTVAQPPKGKPK